MKLFNISPSSSELWVWEMVVMSATQTGLCLNPWKSSWMTHLNSSIHPSLAACSSPVVVTAYFKIHRLPSPWPLCPALLWGSHGTLRPTGRHRFSCVFWLFPHLVLLSVKGAAALRESQESWRKLWPSKNIDLLDLLEIFAFRLRFFLSVTDQPKFHITVECPTEWSFHTQILNPRRRNFKPCWNLREITLFGTQHTTQ